MRTEVICLDVVAITPEDRTTGRVDVVESLVARAKAGDTRAFDTLMVTYQRQVSSTALRLLGNPADALDATQEVFLRLYKYIGTFKESAQLEPWLYRVTVNVCRDHGRKRGSRREVSFEEQRESGSLPDLASEHDLEGEISRAQEQQIISDGLATLTERERSALVLRDLEGLETAEVARILGSTTGTVRSRVCLARIKLKKYRDRILRRQK